MSFAMLEMRIVLAEVLRAYELQPRGAAHEAPHRRNITITPARGSRVGLAPARTREPLAA
jgi:cytochrome P450